MRSRRISWQIERILKLTSRLISMSKSTKMYSSPPKSYRTSIVVALLHYRVIASLRHRAPVAPRVRSSARGHLAQHLVGHPQHLPDVLGGVRCGKEARMMRRQQYALGEQPHAEFILARVIGAHRGALAGYRLVGEVDVEERAHAGHLHRKAGAPGAGGEALAHGVAHRADVFVNRIALQLGERGQPRRHADRIARKGARGKALFLGVRGLLGRRYHLLHQVAPAAEGAHRKTAPDDLADASEVRPHAVVGRRTSESQAKAGDDFV